VAVAKELKRLRPQLEIDWLAQHPVTTVLDAEGEHIHPASQWLANESAHIASEAGGHDLHCFQALRRMDEILVANFMLFLEVVEEGCYDLVIGDEAWDVDYYWHENPELKRGQNVWLTDFVGYLPMPDGGEREAFLTTDYNAEMIEHIDRYPWIRDRAIFVGHAEDIVTDTFGGNCQPSGTGPRSISPIPAISQASPLPSPTRWRRSAPSWVTATTSWSAWSPSAAAASARPSSTRSLPPIRWPRRPCPSCG
jgi:hypothetical protein